MEQPGELVGQMVPVGNGKVECVMHLPDGDWIILVMDPPAARGGVYWTAGYAEYPGDGFHPDAPWHYLRARNLFRIGADGLVRWQVRSDRKDKTGIDRLGGFRRVKFGAEAWRNFKDPDCFIDATRRPIAEMEWQERLYGYAATGGICEIDLDTGHAVRFAHFVR